MTNPVQAYEALKRLNLNTNEEDVMEYMSKHIDAKDQLTLAVSDKPLEQRFQMYQAKKRMSELQQSSTDNLKTIIEKLDQKLDNITQQVKVNSIESDDKNKLNNIYNQLVTPQPQFNSQDEKIDEIYKILCNKMQTRNQTYNPNSSLCRPHQLYGSNAYRCDGPTCECNLIHNRLYTLYIIQFLARTC